MSEQHEYDVQRLREVAAINKKLEEEMDRAMAGREAEARRFSVAKEVFAVLLAQKPPSTFTEGGWRSEVEVLAKRAYEAADIFIRAGEGKP